MTGAEETTSPQGHEPHSSLATWLLAGTMLATPVLVVGGAQEADAGPVGGNVTAGSASINQAGTTTTITQSSNRAIIEWQDFSIGQDELVRFVQPGSNSAVLNRVVSNIPSHILGKLEATGKVYLINPNGIVIGSGAVINTGGFVASTLDVPDQSFMQQQDLIFAGTSDAAVINHGDIIARDGDIYLMAREVRNTGVIRAQKGEVALGAGREILLAEHGRDRMMVRAGFEQGEGEAPSGVGVENSGLIEATQARLEAANGNIYSLAINNTGTVRAQGIQRSADGRLVLKSDGGRLSIGGRLEARNADGSGGRIDVDGGQGSKVALSGSMAVTGRRRSTTRGGEIAVSGSEIDVAASAHLDASGDRGGGSVRLGGGRRGGGIGRTFGTAVDRPRPKPELLSVEKGAELVADARIQGDGGEVVLWSDGATEFHGHISAKGGVQGGDGGFAEISGKEELYTTGLADVTAAKGKAGHVLFDPGDITIVNGGLGFSDWNTVNDGYLGQQLDLGNVTVATANATNGGPGDITLQSTASIDWSADTVLTFEAARDVSLYGDINNTGAGGFEINAGRDIVVSSGSDIRINAPTGANVTPSGAGFDWVAGGDISFDGSVSAMAGGTLHLDAAGDVIFGANTDLAMKHTYDPVGGATSQTGYGTLRVTAGGDITTEGVMRDIGRVWLTAGNDITLNADMTNGGGHVGISYMTATAGNNLTVNEQIYTYGTGSSVLTASNGDLVTNANMNFRRRLTLTANNGTVQIANGQVRTRQERIYLNGDAIQVDATGSLRSNSHLTMTADSYQLDGALHIDGNRYAYIRPKSNNAQLCLGDAVCTDATAGPMIHLTQAELNNIDPGGSGWMMFDQGRYDLVEVSTDVSMGNHHVRFYTDDVKIDGQLTVNNRYIDFFTNGNDVYLGDGGTAAFHMSEAEIGNLQGASWARWFSQNGDMTVDHIHTTNAQMDHLRFDAGVGDLTFRNHLADGSGGVTTHGYLYGYGETITVEDFADLNAGTGRTAWLRLNARNGLEIHDDITVNWNGSHIELDGDSNTDGVGYVHIRKNDTSGDGVAVTVQDATSSIEIRTPELDNLDSTGADGLYLNGGTLSIIPTMTINPGDILAMGIGGIDICKANFCARPDVHVFALDKTEHLDHFYDVGTFNFGSDWVDMLILGDIDYSTLVAGTGNLYLTGNDIRFDEEFDPANPNIDGGLVLGDAHYLRPTGGFNAADVTIIDPTRFDLGTADLVISPTSGQTISGGLAAADTDAYFGNLAGAPTDPSDGLVITNDFLTTFKGRDLYLGSDFRGNRPFRAETTTVNGLDATSTFTGGVYVQGDKIHIGQDGMVSDGWIRLRAVQNYADDALVIDGTVTSNTNYIIAQAYNPYHNIHGNVGGIQYRRRHGGKLTITENGKLVNLQSGSNDYVSLGARSFDIQTAADPTLNPAIVSDRSATIEFLSIYDTVDAYFGTSGAVANNKTHMTAEQMARFDINNGGDLVIRGYGYDRNDNYRTRTDYYVRGLDGDTAFANVEGDVTFISTAYINHGNGDGAIQFDTAASDMGSHNVRFWGQNGVKVNAEVSTSEGYGLHLEAGYNLHGNQNVKIAGITGTGVIDATYLRLEAVGAGIGTAGSSLQTRTGSLWAENASDNYSDHTAPRTGGIYINNDTPYGLALNQAANNGGSGDIVISQTGGGALYVADDTRIDYGKDNPWSLTSQGVSVAADRYKTGGSNRWAQVGNVDLSSTDGVVVLNTITIDDAGASLSATDASYDALTDNVHMLNGDTGSGLISVDTRDALDWQPAGYTAPTVTLDGGTDLRLDRAMDLGAADRLHIAGARDVTVAAPITSAAGGPTPGIAITADRDVILGTNGDVSTTAADGVVSVTATNGAVRMSDDAASTAAAASGTDPLVGGGNSMAAGDTIDIDSTTGTVTTASVAGNQVEVAMTASTGTELKQGTVLRKGTVLEAGTKLPMDVVTDGGTLTAGSVLGTDSTVTVNVELSADTVLEADIALAPGSMVAENSLFRSASLTAVGAAGTTGSITVSAATDIELGRIATQDGTIDLRAGLGGASGAIIDNVAAEMGDATDLAFGLDPSTTDNANLLTEGGAIQLYGKSVGTKSVDGSTFLDVHVRNGGSVQVIDPADPDPANPTLAGAWGAGAGDGAYLSILDSSTVGTFDMMAQAGIGLMQGMGDLTWGPGSNAVTLGGGDILLMTRGLNGSSGDISFTGDLDATNSVTGLTGDVILRAEDNITSAGGVVIGDRLVATASNGTVGTSVATPLRTDVNSIEFGSQNGVYIHDEGTDLSKTITLASIEPVPGVAPAGEVSIQGEASLGIGGIAMSDGDLTLTSVQGDIVNGGGAISTQSSGGAYGVTLDAAGSIGNITTPVDIDPGNNYSVTARSRGTDLAAGQGTYLRALNDVVAASSVSVQSDAHASLIGADDLTWDGSASITAAAGGTVTLRAEGGTAGTGDIRLNAAFTRNEAETVLEADQDVVSTAPVTINTGNLTVTAGNDVSLGGTTSAALGTISVDAGNTITLDADVTATAGDLSLAAGTDILTGGGGGKAVAGRIELDAGNAIDLDTNADQLLFTAGTGGATLREADSVTVSGSTRGGSGGAIDVTAVGDLTVGGVAPTAVTGDGSGFLYADGVSLDVTSSGGSIRLDGRVASVQGGAGGVAYGFGDLATTGNVSNAPVTLTAATDIRDISTAETTIGANEAAASLNVVSDGAVTLNAGGSIGFDAGELAGDGFGETVDVHAGTLVANAGGTAAGQGVFVTLPGSWATTGLGGLTSARHIGVEALENLNVNSAMSAGGNGYLALKARQDVTMGGGAALTGSGNGQVLVEAGNDMAITGGSASANGSGLLTMRAGGTLTMSGGSLTHNGGGGFSGAGTAMDGSPLQLTSDGVLLDAANIDLNGANLSVTDGTGLVVVAGQDLTLQGATVSTTGGGDVVLVADHQSDTSGAGLLDIDLASTVTAGGGQSVSLFTSGPTGYQFDPAMTFNGEDFAEQDAVWGQYYGSGAIGSAEPYQLIFEQSLAAPPPTLPEEMTDVGLDEALRFPMPDLGDVLIGGRVRVVERLGSLREVDSPVTEASGTWQDEHLEALNDSLAEDVSYGVYYDRRGRHQQRQRRGLLEADSFAVNPDREFISALPRYQEPGSNDQNSGGE